MPKDADPPNNPGYVTYTQCSKQVAAFTKEIEAVKKALVGDDMRGGLVADMSEIKSKLSVVKTVIVPIVVSVASAVITYMVLNGM